MSWQKAVKQLNTVADFGGGTETTRGHINELVNGLNSIITEAQRNPEPDNGNVVLLYVNENGVAVKYNFIATKAQLV